jgi:hypothetical protein
MLTTLRNRHIAIRMLRCYIWRDNCVKSRTGSCVSPCFPQFSLGARVQ